MPYIKFLDELRRDLPIPPIDMALIEFRITAARVPGSKYTIINTNFVQTKKVDRACSAVFLALCDDVDTEPFTTVRLEHRRDMRPGDNLAFFPGILRFDMTATIQGCDDYTVSTRPEL